MKKFVLIALLHAFSVCTLAQSDKPTNSVEIQPKFLADDYEYFSLTQTTERTQGARKEISSRELSIEIEIFEETDSGTYIMHWTYQSAERSGGDNEFSDFLYDLMQDVVIIYEINKSGKFVQVLNWEDIQHTAGIRMNAFATENNNKDEVKKIVAEVENIFSSKESIEQNILKDVQWFHSFYGGKYNKNELTKTDSKFPNDFGGPPFPAKLTTEMTSLDEESCTIKITHEPAREKVTQAILEWLAKTSGEKTKKSGSDIEIKDITAFTWNRQTTWMTNLSYSRTVQIDDTKEILLTEMKKED